MSSATNKLLRIGIDFDNTIVHYDRLFHTAALEQGVIPATVAATKTDVRRHLRQYGHEDTWTRLQGTVYGPRMAEAEMFPGVSDFFSLCRAQRVCITIISHRTRYPYLGPKHDLHAAALQWVQNSGLQSSSGAVSLHDWVFFEESRQAKLARIEALQCSLFLDDLLDCLLEPGFPKHAQRVLFDPGGSQTPPGNILQVRSWYEFTNFIKSKLSEE